MMKFRDMACTPKILKDVYREGLVEKIIKLSEEYDLIDLQYSTTTMSNGSIEYSALALVHKRVDK